MGRLEWAGISEAKWGRMLGASPPVPKILDIRTQSQVGFSQNGGGDFLWINTPFSGIRDVVLKVTGSGGNDCAHLEGTWLVLTSGANCT